MAEKMLVPVWAVGVLWWAAIFGGLGLASITPEPYKPWAYLAAIAWPWWPLAVKGYSRWTYWKLGKAVAAKRAQAARETHGLNRP